MAPKDLFGNDLPEPPVDVTLPLLDGSTIKESQLKDAGESIQLEAMRAWFYGHYQNPVEETPYDSEEGGYIFMYGGPFDPKEELSSRFSNLVSDDIIQRLADELGDEAWQWEGRPGPGDYDEYAVESIEPPSRINARFIDNIAKIKVLSQTKIETEHQQFLLRILFASVITALETYLSDKFISSIDKNPTALRKFVESFPQFRKEAMKVSDIFKKSDTIEKQVKSILLGEIVWHKLVSAGHMFNGTFDVDFPDERELVFLLRAVDIRHDLIHRGGKTKEGREHDIKVDNIQALLEACESLVKFIEGQAAKFLAANEPEELPL
jgi:hypothetical protein